MYICGAHFIIILLLCTSWLSNAAVCTYSEQFVHGQTIRGYTGNQCGKWYKFTTCVTGNHGNNGMTKRFKSIILKSSLGGSYSCYDPLIATRLCLFNSHNDRMTYTCNGHTWRSSVCGWGSGVVGSSGCFSVDQKVLRCGTGGSLRPCIAQNVRNKSRSVPDWGGIGTNCNAPSQTLTLICGDSTGPPAKAPKKYDGCRFSGNTISSSQRSWKSYIQPQNFPPCKKYRMMQKCTRGKTFRTVTLSSSDGGTVTCSDPKVANSVCTKSWDKNYYVNRSHGICNGQRWISGWYKKGIEISVGMFTGQCVRGSVISVCSGYYRRQGGVKDTICGNYGRTLSMSCGIAPAPTKKPTAPPTKKQTPTAGTYYYNGYYYFNNGSWVGYYE